MRAAALLSLVMLAACSGPPPSAYIGGSSVAAGTATPLGSNTSGEACTQQAQGTGTAIFCGTWQQPSGHVARGETAGAASLSTLATASTWRVGIDARFTCADPVSSTILGGVPSVVLACTRKVGGWPQVALVASVDGVAYYADGILPALPVLERSIGVLSGKLSPDAAPRQQAGGADALIASRLAAQSFGAGDIGQYEALMTAGARANLSESYVASEQAYRAALALQRKVLGPANPNTALPLMHLAVQLSNEGRSNEANALFAQATPLATRAADATALPQLEHYRALSLINEGKYADSLPLLRAAEASYSALLPSDLLIARAGASRVVQATSSRGGLSMGAPEGVLLEPNQQTALIGVIEARRYQAIALRERNRPAEAQAMIRSAEALASARGLNQRTLTARLYRTAAATDDASASGAGQSGMRLASRDFADAQPGSRPLAQTYLLRAAQLMRSGAAQDALPLCREGASLLSVLHAGTSADLMSPCLAAYAAQAAQDAPNQQTLLAEMFGASQLVQGSVTSQQIALASARLSAGTRDPKVSAAIRRRQDAGIALAELERRRDILAQGGPRDVESGPPISADELSKQIAAAQAALADADGALQAAAPNYGQLVQDVVSANDVLAALGPGEAFASISLTQDGGWVFVLRDGKVSAAPTGVGIGGLGALVKRIRVTVEPAQSGPPPFDTEAARMVYADTLGKLDHELDGATSLVVAPVGPLLSVPFGLLLTGPTDQRNLAAAPWLIRRYAISHVPAPANFVSLRKVASSSRAAQPWFGFGDFRPVTLPQAEASFPATACEDSAKLFAGLPPLPFARRELAAAQALLGGSPSDALEGAAFTAPRVMQEDLRPYRVLHFATHALLPSDLRCQTEPAIVTSNPAGAKNAAGALLTASDVMGMRLDADAVILSACNSAGPDGSSAGESLSGLARAFFYAGARAMMVTHWSVNDQATALLVAGTLQRLRAGNPQGLAGALRGAQLSILDDAGKGLPAVIAHPFFWAPFGLVGEGRGRTLSAERDTKGPNLAGL
jgi:CHAT domain-containing protein